MSNKTKGSDKANKAKKKSVSDVVIHIHASFNNTIVNITDKSGNTLVFASAGQVGFKGSRKSTPYAAQCTTSNALKTAKANHNIKRAIVNIKGPGFGRESALRSLMSVDCEILAIIDRTPVPHNGCRPPKRRRL